MKIAIISDTHNNLNNIQLARRVILTQDIGAVIHCGDLTDADVLDYFGDFRLYCVFGNGDYAPEVEERVMWLGEENKAGESLELVLASRRIFVTHGHWHSLLREAIESGSYDYVFHGHTHRFKDEKVANTRVINPGSLGGKRVENRSFVILDLADGALTRLVEPF